MGYFSNGTEGERLENQCDDCIHGMSEDVFCPVAFVQEEYNYKQLGNDDLTAALNFLIDKRGSCQVKPLIDEMVEDAIKAQGK